MKNSELINYIESEYDVKSIKYQSLNLWLELRSRVFTLISLDQESTLNINVSTYKTILLTSCYGFLNWFKKYDAWVFSSKINRLNIDGKYHDRLYEYIGSKYDKTLFIEVTTDTHFKRKLVASRYIVSKSALILVEKFVSMFINTKKINFDVIKQINKDFEITFNPNYVTKKMIAQYKVMRFILKIKKPKVVFLSPAYNAYGYIKAFKEKGVKVVEVQHGVIIKEHFGYNIRAKFDDIYFVDYLLTYGEQEIEVFKKNNGIKSENVIAVGNYYLDYIKGNYQADKKLSLLVEAYEKTLVVSLQEVDKTETLITELLKSAKENPKILYIFKPRKISAKVLESKFEVSDNVVFIDNQNIYQLILQTDFHVTVYSTCAIEAPALGKQNILFNINNLSKSIFETTLTNPITTTYVNNLSDFNKLIKNIKPQCKAKVLEAHKSVIKSNYKNNINDFLLKIGLGNE